MTASTRMRRVTVITVLLAALLLSMVLAVALGAVSVGAGEILRAAGRAITGEPRAPGDAVIVDIRLPRVVLAALVGACLAAAGVLYQALFRNPLADPYILGMSSGAGLGAVIALTLTASATALRFGVVPAGAFAGAVLTIFLVVKLASLRGALDVTSLLLAGVAISYALSAITSFVMVFFRESMASVVFWMMGGLTAASWSYVLMVIPMLVLGLAVPMTSTRELNLMLLGEERAGELGLDAERYKRALLGSGALLVAGAVSVSGLIGFVGLMTPHMARLIVGPDHRLLLPASTIGGAIVMVLADLVARTALAPVEIPVGIVTAFVGAPFFIWLLVRRKDHR
ncbi:MAG: iron ABC transporter permease [Coriobacteriia bacterium]|nr:iron ABC transporter permease [Coriobacteriia bacterium]